MARRTSLMDKECLKEALVAMGLEAREAYSANEFHWRKKVSDARDFKAGLDTIAECKFWHGYMMAIKHVLDLIQFDRELFNVVYKNNETLRKLMEAASLSPDDENYKLSRFYEKYKKVHKKK